MINEKIPVHLEILAEKLATALLLCVEMKVDEKFFSTLENTDVIQLSWDICIAIPQAIEHLLKHLKENENGISTLTIILGNFIANSCLHKLAKDEKFDRQDITHVVH